MSLSLDGPAPQTKNQLLARLREILKAGWLEMPADVKRYNGHGAPGNKDVVDAVGWEVKFHTPKTSLITLFHKEPEPKGILRYMVSKYGWKDKKGRLSFRHTIHGQSDRFVVVDDAGSIIVRPLEGNGPVPTWSHDILLNIAGGKLRRLVSMEGQRSGRTVKYNRVVLFENLHLTQLAQDLVNGRLVVDFDVRENTAGSKALRNHGTKFRVAPKDLHRLYHKHELLS